MAVLQRLKFWNRPAQSLQAFDAPLRPYQPMVVVGDVHGALPLLKRLLPAIDKSVENFPPEEVKLVFVGDLVDRGEDSAGALEFVRNLETEFSEQVICLLGNHEKMMLDFIDNPEERGPRWLKYGGLQTLASYGIGSVNENAPAARLEDARDKLLEQLPAGSVEWLRARPLMWQNGNVVVVHAGANPNAPIDDQRQRHLIWGHRDFFNEMRKDGIWVAHGHTVVDAPTAAFGRINTDTGACFTGRLTAATILTDEIRFIST